MYKQVLDPVGDSLFASTIFAVLPIATLFVLLGIVRLKAHVQRGHFEFATSGTDARSYLHCTKADGHLSR